MISKDFGHKINWSWDYINVGSDHYPIGIELKLQKIQRDRKHVKVSEEKILKDLNDHDKHEIYLWFGRLWDKIREGC